jgi:hypothetical protein
MDITKKADDMNAALGKDINKTIYERYIDTSVKQNQMNPDANGQYHTGGIAGRRPMPHLHVGGLASQFLNTPNHNEVDVRLLRDEMVLTQAQQSNLMRMIDAGFTGKNNDSKQGKTTVYDVKVDAKNVDLDEQQLVRYLQRMEALYGG